MYGKLTSLENRGGARKGAGRKPAIEKKVRIYASVKESKVTEAKEKIKQLVNKLNK